MNSRRKKPVSAPPAKRTADKAGAQRNKIKGIGLPQAGSLLLIAAAAALLIASFFFSVLKISGGSMEPGLNDGDILLLVKTRGVNSGDLVGFRWNGKTLLKRVVACPGDWVTLDETGRVYVNGVKLDEPYVAEFAYGENDVEYPFQVPDDSYFVMGDNRVASVDSRSSRVGCVRADQIIGRCVARLWPLH